MKNDKSRGLLGIVFGIVFLDIVGFSIIFPLYPDMLAHYLAQEGDGSWIAKLTAWLAERTNEDEHAVVTFFGGILGSLYGVLQFVFTPIWGGISDRIGRRPTLLFTTAGTALAHLGWAFSGSFGLLIATRLFAGCMAGNISTAAAVVADTTTPEKRAGGMGMVGMAIGLGFILGPFLGTLFISSDPLAGDWSTGFALNPFSGAAFCALALGVANLVFVVTRLPETRTRAQAGHERVANPFKALASLAVPGAVAVSLIYFVYLTAFAAMEFTLTFLARERFDFSIRDFALMFVFIGLIIALVQGGVVRRLAPRVGEKRLTLVGLALLMPGLAGIGHAPSVPLFYVALAFLGVGSALVMPCLAALASRYAPPERQGLAQGTFRSMGSLSRAIGPILGGLVYWQLGGPRTYVAAALVILVPLALAVRLPAPPDLESSR